MLYSGLASSPIPNPVGEQSRSTTSRDRTRPVAHPTPEVHWSA